MSRKKFIIEESDGFRIRLSQVLEKTKLRQYQFAEKIGVSSGAFSQFLSGKRYPNKATFLLMEIIFGINLNWLKTGHGEMLIRAMPVIAEPSEKYQGAKEQSLLKQLVNSSQELADERKKIIALQDEIRNLEKELFSLKNLEKSQFAGRKISKNSGPE